MTNECCTNNSCESGKAEKIEKNIPENSNQVFTSLTKSGKKWVPTYLMDVDAKKCIGCGKCVQICMGKCYKLKDIEHEKRSVVINGRERVITVKRIAEVDNTDNCYGDCHCHLICPVNGAIICAPKLITVFN